LSVNYQTLDCLQENGIAASDIQKLNEAGFHTVESVSLSRSCRRNLFLIAGTLTSLLSSIPQVAHATIRKLSEVKGISEAKVQKIKDIVKAMVPMSFKTAADALEDRK
jgi:DNA repair protein RAD51